MTISEHEVEISILIPTHNRKEFLQRALQSCLRESFPGRSEIIVLDNCSTDGTQPWLERFVQNPEPALPQNLVVRVIRQAKNLGMVGNWQTGLLLAQGKYIKILCDDDSLLPGAIEREWKILRDGPHIGLVASARREIDLEGRLTNLKCFSSMDRELTSEEALRAMLLEENIFGPPSAVMFRRSALKKFDENYQYATDWAAWLEIAQNNTTYFLATPGCEIDLHMGNLTKKMVDLDIDFYEVFELRYSAWRLLQDRQKLELWDTIDFFRLIFYRALRRIARHALAQEFSRIPAFLHHWVLQYKKIKQNGIRFKCF